LWQVCRQGKDRQRRSSPGQGKGRAGSARGLCALLLPLLATFAAAPQHALLPPCLPAAAACPAELSKEPNRQTVTEALEMLRRMTHRGACGCETNTGACVR
jgi:hypothetical protein